MRSEPSWLHFDPAVEASYAATPGIVDHTGAAVALALFPGAVAQTVQSIARLGNSLATVPYRQIPALAAVNSGVLYLNQLNGYTTMRVETLRLKFVLRRPVFIITDATPVTAIATPHALGGPYEPGLFSSLSSTPLGRYLTGLGSAPDPNAAVQMAIPDSAITYAPATVVDKQQFDIRHLQPGWSALSTGLRPVPVHNPLNVLAPDRRRALNAFLSAEAAIAANQAKEPVDPEPDESDAALGEALTQKFLLFLQQTGASAAANEPPPSGSSRRHGKRPTPSAVTAKGTRPLYNSMIAQDF
jgi:hypothetical protein